MLVTHVFRWPWETQSTLPRSENRPVKHQHGGVGEVEWTVCPRYTDQLSHGGLYVLNEHPAQL